MKALVAGWFSYANGHATAGDILAKDLLCDWLDERGIAYDVAVAPPFDGGHALDALDPANFSHAIFICGPFGRKELEGDFFRRFGHCRLIGLNLSLDLSRRDWNPFDYLIERDSDLTTNPDLLFASRQPLPPVVGVCLVEDHPEAEVARADAAIEALLARHSAARVDIDTRLDVNSTGLRSEGEVEAVIARMDALVTTRLHGLVLALKNGVPALVIDAVPGGGKITRQCARIGWPNIVRIEDMTEGALDSGLQFALGKDARAAARDCADRARADVLALRDQFVAAIGPAGEVERNYAIRQTPSGRAKFQAALPVTEADEGAAPDEKPAGLTSRLRRRFREVRR